MKFRIRFIAVIMTLSLLLFTRNYTVAKKSINIEEANLRQFSSYTSDYQISRMGHVSRLPEYDKIMNMVGYQNLDGTKTVYVFEENIKFIDYDGTIKEKDPTIMLNDKVPGYLYSQKSNNIQTYFSDGNDGISTLFTDGNYSIRIYNGSHNTHEVSINNDGIGDNANNYIQYNNAFGNNTHLRYTTGLNGFKEDIILEYYYGQNIFSFFFETNLIPRSNGRAIIFSNDNEQDIFYIPGISVYDSNSKDGINYCLDNQIEINQEGENKYVASIIVNKDFLENPKTIYPVYIDPTILSANQGISADAVVYSDSGKANIEFGYDTINMVGYSSSNGYGYFYTKFNLTHLNIRYDNIISAYYHVKELSGKTDDAAVNTYLTTGQWSESTLKWNNKPSDLTKIVSSCRVIYNNSDYSNNNWYDFYITQPVMGWIQGTYNYGIVLKLEETNTYRAFASKEYVSYVPSLYITYMDEAKYEPGLGLQTDVYYIKNKESKNYLTYSYSSTYGVYTTAFDDSDKQKWVISQIDTNYWTISPLDNRGLYLSLYNNSSGAYVSLSAQSTNTDYQKWKGIRRWNGSFGFQPKLSYTSGNGFTLTEYGNSLIAYQYVMDYNFSQDWTLEPVYLGDLDFYSQGTPIDELTIDYADEVGFSTYNYYNLNSYNAGTIYSFMPADMFVITCSHGWPGGIEIGDTESNYSYLIANSPSTPQPNSWYISNYPPNELKGVYGVVYDACSAGQTSAEDNSNLIGITYKRGAHFSLGWTISIYGNDFKLNFMNYLNQGKSVYEAMRFAIENNTFSNDIWNCHYLGDEDIVFKHINNT